MGYTPLLVCFDLDISKCLLAAVQKLALGGHAFELDLVTVV